MRASELIQLIGDRVTEFGDMEVTTFDDESCSYVPVTHVQVTKDFNRPVDVMVLSDRP
jgi:hypothetical protein